MTHSRISWIVIAIPLIDFVSIQTNAGSVCCEKFLDTFTIPCKTPGPLNIESSKVQDVILPPLIFDAKLHQLITLANTGTTIEGTTLTENSTTTITGGPFLEDTYILHTLKFYWSSNTTGPAATTIDKEDGAPIEGIIYWYNRKYGSFEEAKKHRNGMAGTVFQARIGPSNLAFTPFGEVLREIRTAGSSKVVDIVAVLIWLDGYVYDSPYVAYPSSYTDTETGNQYYCSTTTTFLPQTVYISQEQFENSFLQLEDSDKEPMTYVTKTYPQLDRPVVQTEGQVQFFFP